MGQGGCVRRVHTHDEQRDENHPQAGEEEQAASRPVVRQRCQDLRKEGGYYSDAGGKNLFCFVGRNFMKLMKSIKI